MEVAKNTAEPLEPLQGVAAIIITTIIKTAAPHLQVVNHRGQEGLPMLEAYRRRLEALRARAGGPSVTLPFVPAAPQRMMTAAAGSLAQLVAPHGTSPPLSIAERVMVPTRREAPQSEPAALKAAALAADPVPMLIGPIRAAVRPPPRIGPALIAPITRVTRPESLPGTETDTAGRQ
jgi:hypothetical protein